MATGYYSVLEVFMDVALNMELAVGKTAKRNKTKLYTQLEIVVKDIWKIFQGSKLSFLHWDSLNFFTVLDPQTCRA